MPGNQIVYTISYGNAGTDAATAVVITEAYDANVTFVSAVPAPDATFDNQWTIGNLAAGGSGTITVTVAGEHAPGQRHPDQQQRHADRQRGSTSASETTTVNSAPSLSITKTDNPDPVVAGNQIVYTISYGNAGTDAATGVVITEAYDSNVTFVSAIPAPTSGDNVWTIGNLAAGGSGTITVTVAGQHALGQRNLINQQRHPDVERGHGQRF